MPGMSCAAVSEVKLEGRAFEERPLGSAFHLKRNYPEVARGEDEEGVEAHGTNRGEA